MQHLVECYDNQELNDLRYIETQKKKHANERCLMLYEKGKIKNEVNKIMFMKNEELKKVKELVSCTFKPKLNKKILQGDLDNHKMKLREDQIYKRNVTWMLRNAERIMREKNKITSEAVHKLTHKPKVDLT
jgi:hypothetical protein